MAVRPCRTRAGARLATRGDPGQRRMDRHGRRAGRLACGEPPPAADRARRADGARRWVSPRPRPVTTSCSTWLTSR
ncbi:MAG: hypothetical protein GEV07_15470 [Streptosporangiales bacterium]|nr:hypothetical protein [Streptosporangiales bacterium]